MNTDKAIHTVTFGPYNEQDRSFQEFYDKYETFQERMNHKANDPEWQPLGKFRIKDDSAGFTCDMRSFTLHRHPYGMPEGSVASPPESSIRREEIIPFLTKLREKGLRWPFFAGEGEWLLMNPNKYFRFFPLVEGIYTVNNRLGLPVDWKSILHHYDGKNSTE